MEALSSEWGQGAGASRSLSDLQGKGRDGRGGHDRNSRLSPTGTRLAVRLRSVALNAKQLLGAGLHRVSSKIIGPESEHYESISYQKIIKRPYPVWLSG